MTAPSLLLHVGYHKTATSWMQRRLFTPDHGYHQIADHDDVFRHIVQPHGLHFDPAPMRALIARRLAETPAGHAPVISSEVLSGHPFQGGRESDVFAERLAQIAPDSLILVSIRDQLRILPSVYMQYVLRGGTMPWPQFFAGTEEPGYFGFSPQHFEYDALVAKYQSLFGADRVYVLTQESIRDDMETAARDLADFAQNTRFETLSPSAHSVNAPSYPEYGVSLLRRLNHVQTSTLSPRPIVSLGRTPKGLYKLAGFILKRPPVKTMMGGRKPVSDYVKTQFSGHFTDSNVRLKNLITHPLNLSTYG